MPPSSLKLHFVQEMYGPLYGPGNRRRAIIAVVEFRTDTNLFNVFWSSWGASKFLRWLFGAKLSCCEVVTLVLGACTCFSVRTLLLFLYFLHPPPPPELPVLVTMPGNISPSLSSPSQIERRDWNSEGTWKSYVCVNAIFLCYVWLPQPSSKLTSSTN